ncbi:MAG: hypothetical protein ACJ8H8_31330 [Geminicoccaceae bacterium]|jgi:hypothetical protein
MHANEGLLPIGWVVLGLVGLGLVLSLLFGFSSVFYLAVLLVPVAFVVLLQLCGGKVEA